MSERRLLRAWPQRWPLRPVPRGAWHRQRPTYRDADPALIDSALQRALQRPSGNWYVLGAGRDVRPGRPFAATIAGTELVAWRDSRTSVVVGPGACPHLGAPLADGRVCDGALICRWHGLRLAGRPRHGWRPFPAHDDGVLVWVRLDHIGGEPPTDAPILPARPSRAKRLDAVYTTVGSCEPADIIANRLDPWHGSWFHPYSFAHLTVRQTPSASAAAEADRFLVDVTFRAGGALGAPVVAEFTCPEPRTIVMRILAGEGTGSIVETHATPVGPDDRGRARTLLTEAVLATSDRPGFRLARTAAPLLRPLVRHAAARLWRDDLAYAERRYWLRTAAGRQKGQGGW